MLGAVAVRATGGSEELEPYLEALMEFGSGSREAEGLISEDGLAWIVESTDRIGELFNTEDE